MKFKKSIDKIKDYCVWFYAPFVLVWAIGLGLIETMKDVIRDSQENNERKKRFWNESRTEE